MNDSIDEILSLLKNAAVRPTTQRVKVLSYLLEHKSHPSVEQIHAGLSAQEPLLSRATVYNTLHLLARAGLVREITIDDNETRYDAQLETHGHFRCISCGSIHNFTVKMDDIPFSGLERFTITGRDVFFKGLCPNCQKQAKKEKEKNG